MFDEITLSMLEELRDNLDGPFKCSDDGLSQYLEIVANAELNW